MHETPKTVLILGANSDVARETIRLFVQRRCFVIAASRDLEALRDFLVRNNIPEISVDLRYFDAADYASHKTFYESLIIKPNLVLYAAGFLSQNDEAMHNWERALQMMRVHYCGAVSILNIIATDDNPGLERIIGLSSLSGVRGRKSNFIYGSTKAAFTQYLAGLRQYLFPRRVIVNVIIAGYIRSKMTAGLNLPESLMLEPTYIAESVVDAGNGFVIVPGFKWKIIYHILRILPERLVAKLP